jgi:hypothetical protein
MASDSPNQLVAQAVAGDRPVIRRLLLRSNYHLAGTITLQLPVDSRGVISAEDLCHDTYIEVSCGIGSFRPSVTSGSMG